MGCVSVTYVETELGFEPLPHATGSRMLFTRLFCNVSLHLLPPKREKNPLKTGLIGILYREIEIVFVLALDSPSSGKDKHEQVCSA